MITFKNGNLFDSNCQTLVNTVNCKGVMGAGIALQFKEKFPKMFNDYKIACKYGVISSGGDIWTWTNNDMFNYKKILCFATKENWKYPSKLEWIERGLKTFTYGYKSLGITSIAWPKLGCNNGKLNWEHDVKPLMIQYLQPLNINCEIYE
jgi:O-acetyl-ADP-ribose deacetylase (regulator of RNase III)